jgi:hypothetical protein
MLDPLGSAAEPGEYDLCFHHAARSTPPTGWTLRDRAPSREPVTESAPPVGPDRGQGVARLAAALSAVHRAVSEDAPDAAPGGTDRSGEPVRLVTDGPAVADGPSPRPSGSARLDSLLQPSVAVSAVAPVPLSERTPEAAVRPVPQPLRLAPDPTTTVWCADLLAPPAASPAPAAAPLPAPLPASGRSSVQPSVPPTLFA